MKMNETWEGEEYEIDFSDFEIDELERLESYLSVLIAFRHLEVEE